MFTCCSCFCYCCCWFLANSVWHGNIWILPVLHRTKVPKHLSRQRPSSPTSNWPVVRTRLSSPMSIISLRLCAPRSFAWHLRRLCPYFPWAIDVNSFRRISVAVARVLLHGEECVDGLQTPNLAPSSLRPFEKRRSTHGPRGANDKDCERPP